jgi:hypothetical protein
MGGDVSSSYQPQEPGAADQPSPDEATAPAETEGTGEQLPAPPAAEPLDTPSTDTGTSFDGVEEVQSSYLPEPEGELEWRGAQRDFAGPGNYAE